MEHFRNRLPCAASALLLAAITAGALSYYKNLGNARPNVILVTIDTLRADRLGSHGHVKGFTPFLDRLARNSIQFSQAYSPSSWTAPAMASLMTSQYPASHRVTHGAVRGDGVIAQERLPERFVTWAEAMKSAGYSTFGVSTNLHLSAALGFAQGFDHFEDLGFALTGQLQRKLREHHEELRGSEPYFLWLHFFDPHLPYTARRPWIAASFPEHESMDARLSQVTDQTQILEEFALEKDDRQLDYLKALYDSEISFVDQALSEILAEIDPDGEALIVVTSDHGEEFLEHGGMGHGWSLYEDQVRVPLLFRLPEAQDRQELLRTPLSLVDVLPSSLHVLNLPVPESYQGQNAMERFHGGKARDDRSIFAELSLSLELRSLMRGQYKWIGNLKGDEKSGFFNLLIDPGEQHNLIVKQKKRARRFKRDYERWESLHRSNEPDVLVLPDSKTIEDLKSMGYIGN